MDWFVYDRDSVMKEDNQNHVKYQNDEYDFYIN